MLECRDSRYLPVPACWAERTQKQSFVYTKIPILMKFAPEDLAAMEGALSAKILMTAVLLFQISFRAG